MAIRRVTNAFEYDGESVRVRVYSCVRKRVAVTLAGRSSAEDRTSNK